MAGAMRKVGEYLGLVEQADFDEDYDELEPTGTSGPVRQPAPVAQIDRHRADERSARPSAAQRETAQRESKVSPLHDYQGTTEHSRSITELTRIETVTPRTYNDARTVGEHFRDRVPVIMNLSEIDDNDAKRLVDFAAGLVFAVHGTLNRVTAKVFLLSPSSVTVTDEDKQRIAAGGFYNQS